MHAHIPNDLFDFVPETMCAQKKKWKKEEKGETQTAAARAKQTHIF